MILFICLQTGFESDPFNEFGKSDGMLSFKLEDINCYKNMYFF